MELVKQFKDITLQYEATAGSATLTIQTDLPGGTLALRRTITLPVTTGREVKTFPLDNPSLLEGKEIQFKVTPNAAGKCILFMGEIRFRKIGEYLDGASGDIWETQPLAF